MTPSLGRILVVDDEPQVGADAVLLDLRVVAAAVVLPPGDPAHRSDRPGS